MDRLNASDRELAAIGTAFGSNCVPWNDRDAGCIQPREAREACCV